MLYLSQMLGEPVIDANGEKIGSISDLAIQTGEVFPRITSLAFLGPGKTPFMISWRKYVKDVTDDGIELKVDKTGIRFSYLQPDEVLLARDLLDRQIVDHARHEGRARKRPQAFHFWFATAPARCRSGRSWHSARVGPLGRTCGTQVEQALSQAAR